MTTSLTPRFKLYRWSDDNDPWARDQFTNNFDQIEANAAMATVGLFADRPPPVGDISNNGTRRFYLATDTRQMFFSDGTTWFEVDIKNTAAAAPTAGAWNRGDRVWSTVPAASGNAGWICVAGGTPGTWKTFGAIGA